MEFTLDDHGLFQTAQARFASWAGFLDRSGRYGGPGPGGHSDGSVEIVFAPEGRDTSPLSAEELALVQWFLDHEPQISAAVKAAVVKHYADLQSSGDFSAEEKRALLPVLSSPDDLRQRIGLYAINIHQTDNAGTPYAGFEFGCTWDDEHGLGVLMHGARLVAIGSGDCAHLLWIAEADAERG